MESVVELQNKDRKVFYPEKPDAELAEKLNTFHSRFDICDFNDELSNFRNGPAGCKINIDKVIMCESFGRVKRGKALVLMA